MKLVREKGMPPIIPFCGYIAKDLFRDTGRIGLFHFGAYEFGAENEIGRDFDGVYQMRHGRDGRIAVKMRFQKSREEYPTVARVACWNKFAAGMAAWKALTIEQKMVYNEVGKRRKKYGSNLFMKQYMLS
ncbi:MAG: hypothetical protein A2Y67_03855 [Candidatus Buchananbacteria bacterium RBG_13_39_9]|uniref:Uncharacterized protein n=1 Tax=Candidatus Buchananbacteria bacterium RBG_13_39_9 TaxID=1797531 RepID=A0A1G1XQP5_9BACT|nr:MAG: hypothetical protein A2Y67_03855 [Candidatus Buchananbacteria bacterium RBG_13_39_9]